MPRILLAEDDDSMRAFLAKALTRSGYEVEDVDNGLDALVLLGERHFELLLADVVMPGMDGIELARRAAKEQPGIRVMFITGFAAVALKARDQGPAGARVLSKPFHLRDLVGQIDAMLQTAGPLSGKS